MLTDLLENKTLLSLVISLAVILAVFFLRNLLARLLTALLFGRVRRRDPAHYKNIRTALKNPAAFMIFAGAVRGAIGFMGIPPPYDAVAVDVTASLFIASAIWFLFAVTGIAVSKVLVFAREPDSNGRKINPTALSFISSALQAAVIVIGILIILSRWVSNISGLIAGFGIGGLAIALAAQDTLSNLFGSIAVMLDKPFEIGDWVEIEGHMGVIEKIGLRSSRIRALDQSIVSIPNAKLASSIIINGTRRGRRRVAFKLGVVYSTPPDKIQALIDIIKTILTADEQIETESMLVCLDGFSGSSIDIFVCYYTMSDYTTMMLAKERINFEILKATSDTGVSIAFPSVSVYREK